MRNLLFSSTNKGGTREAGLSRSAWDTGDIILVCGLPLSETGYYRKNLNPHPRISGSITPPSRWISNAKAEEVEERGI